MSDDISDAVPRLKKALETLKYSSQDGAVAGAQVVLKESQEIVPVDTGALKSTGAVSSSEKWKGKVGTAVVGYGGISQIGPTKNTGPNGEVNYAIQIHETNTPYLLRGVQNAEAKIKDAIVTVILEKLR